MDTYYARNREQVLARRKARRLVNPDKLREQGRQQMIRWRATHPRISPHHGLTPEELQDKLTAQGGQCAVCSTTSGKWHGDHDHATGMFRGVLCNRCNMALGLFKDNPNLCRIAANYLELKKLC